MTTYSQAEVVDWLEELAAGQLDLYDDNMGLAQAAIVLLQGDQPAPEPLPEGNLSPHFTLAEMIYSETADANGLSNDPPAADVDALEALCNDTLEQIRTLCGDNPVVISSGYRSPAVNALVGGASNSAHLYGCAADFTIPAYGSVTEVCNLLQGHLHELEIDQLIKESGGGATWVHVGRAIPPSTEPRYECLTINDSGTFNGIV
jgi:hypothetical protein